MYGSKDAHYFVWCCCSIKVVIPIFKVPTMTAASVFYNQMIIDGSSVPFGSNSQETARWWREDEF